MQAHWTSVNGFRSPPARPLAARSSSSRADTSWHDIQLRSPVSIRPRPHRQLQQLSGYIAPLVLRKEREKHREAMPDVPSNHDACAQLNRQWLPSVHGDLLSHDSCQASKGIHGTVSTLPPHDTRVDVHSKRTDTLVSCHRDTARACKRCQSVPNAHTHANSQPEWPKINSNVQTSTCMMSGHMQKATGSRVGSSPPSSANRKAGSAGQLTRISMCDVSMRISVCAARNRWP